MRIAGCDCGKDSLTVAVLEEMPSDLKKQARRYRPVICKANREGVDKLLSLNADIYALEPTGNYSRLWLNTLKGASRDVRLINANRVKNLMRMYGIQNKSDRLDCFAIAAYTHLHKDNEKAFLSDSQTRLRDLCHDRIRLIKTATRLKNQVGNRLTYEVPELVSS